MSSVKKVLLGFIGDKILAPAVITSVTAVSENFRLIEIQSESFASSKWKPGDKIQLNVGGWNVRTYTPLTLDAESKVILILAYLHGKGPGSAWAADLKVGDSCQVLGPRSSLDFSSYKTPTIFFGDETSFGAALTLNSKLKATTVLRFVFEVADPDECRKVLQDLDLSHAKLIQRTENGAHLSEVGDCMQDTYLRLNDPQFVMTGNAGSILQLRSRFKIQPMTLKTMKVKAYWAEGKVGID